MLSLDRFYKTDAVPTRETIADAPESSGEKVDTGFSTTRRVIKEL